MHYAVNQITNQAFCSVWSSSSGTWTCTHSIIRSTQQRHRYFSDNLLGYSPMAPQTPTLSTDMNKTKTRDASLNTLNMNTTGMYGAPLSSKQSKLAELRLELKDGHTTLEDAASLEQRMDLYMVQGISLVAKATDRSWTAQQQQVEQQQLSHDVTKELEKWLSSQDGEEFLSKTAFETYLLCVSQKVDSLLVQIDENYRKQHSQEQLLYYSTLPDLLENESYGQLSEKNDSIGVGYDACSDQKIAQDFDTSCFKLRLLLVNAAAQHLMKSWDTLTNLTDADIDRAAVTRTSVERPSTLAASKVTSVLLAYTTGTCVDRVRALWSLIDHDNDDLVEQEEMATIVYMSMKPVEEALKAFFKQSITASSHDDPHLSTWRQRRAKKQKQKKLEKLFQQTIDNHFDIEIEIAHRLRCVYAWANKTHQDGKVASTLVATTGTSFRSQRYVELNPKISFEEFREEQKSFFPHLDATGEELMKGLKEDLLLHQGFGRQNKELKRDCIIFFTIVSLIDVALYYV